ncbi:MAG: MBL fold metallo-hydrolase [Chloroflexi bacterium]|nr:MBL fold metallo-hydrolase [Chloroflexota bacterium]
MQAFICRTCGVQYAPSERPPERCPICDDERQYVGWNGQQWAVMSDFQAQGRTNHIYEEEPGLHAIDTRPQIAIGQRALLVQTPNGNVMWDCITLIDDATIGAVRRLGGLAAIAISHPHFYSSNVTWSDAFDGCPVYIHAADAQWVQYSSPAVQLWEGATREILPGITLINTGGHFEGSQVLHWAAGQGGRGALLSSDSVTVTMDRRYVSFMYSYPNLIPLGERAITRIVDSLRPFSFQRIYGGWNNRVVSVDGSDAVERSAERYLRFIRET